MGTAAIARSACEPMPLDDPTCVWLERLYQGLSSGDEIPVKDLEAIDQSGGHDAYGELTVRGVREIRSLLRPVPGDVFYDLGSGTGRGVLQAAREWSELRHAVGIELAGSRDEVARTALRRAESEFRERISLRRGDMIACVGCEDASLVYVASLLFDDAFMERLGTRLVSLPQLRVVASLRPFPMGSLPGFIDAERNHAAEGEAPLDERVEVTWGAARVYLYTRE